MMLNFKFFIIIIIILCLIGGINYFLNDVNQKILDQQEIPIVVYVTGKEVGFNLDGGDINFGILRKGNSVAQRSLELWNNRSIPVKLEFEIKGEVKNWISLREKEFNGKISFLILQPFEKKNMEIEMNLSKKLLEERKYEGQIVIITKKLD